MNKPFLPSDRIEHEKFSALAAVSWAIRAKAIASRSSYHDAVAFLDANRLPASVERTAKAAIGAGSTTSSTLGTEGIAIGAWSDAMRAASAYYAVFSDNGFTRIPMMQRAGMVTSAPTGGTVGEGASIPVSKIIIGNIVLSPVKAGALMVLTAELLLATDPGGQAMFSRQLSAALGAAVDSTFANILSTGLTPITSSGANKDVRALLLAVNTLGIAKPYFIGSTDIGKLGASLATYFPAFEGVTATGGTLAGAPLLISSGLALGTLFLIDGSGIASDAAPPEITVSGSADILMDTVPPMNSTTPTPAQLVSMYATDSFAIKGVAVFGAAKLRADACAVCTGVSTTTWVA
jgi:hypothetical protein